MARLRFGGKLERAGGSEANASTSKVTVHVQSEVLYETIALQAGAQKGANQGPVGSC